MKFTYNDKTVEITRYPETKNQSLQPWSAGDELLLKKRKESIEAEPEMENVPVSVYHDRFGFLGTVLQESNPYCVLNYSSQEKALRQNLTANELPIRDELMFTVMKPLPEPVGLVLMKIPKSLELFRVYLHHVYHNSSDDATVYAAFMTRNFTPQMVEAAQEYFQEAEQSMAVKKARVLKLSKKKASGEVPSDISHLMNEVKWERKDAPEVVTLKQYFGVFSGDGVDPATNLLLENMTLKEEDKVMLDLGCGNGIIAKELLLRSPEAEVHALDDDLLAVESAKINLGEKAAVHHYDGPDMFPDEFFDLIVTNPPAHLGHENNIEVSIRLFRQAHKKLKPGGRLVIASSRHINYLSHLKKLYPTNEILVQSGKFEVTVSVKQE